MPLAHRMNSAVNSGQQACYCPNAAFTCPNRSKRLRLQHTAIHHHQQPSLHAETSFNWPHMPTQVPDSNDKQAAPSQPLSEPAAYKQPHCCCSRGWCEQQLRGVQMAQAPPLMEALLVSTFLLRVPAWTSPSSQHWTMHAMLHLIPAPCLHELHLCSCTPQETICSCFSRRPAWQTALQVGPPASLSQRGCRFMHAVGGISPCTQHWCHLASGETAWTCSQLSFASSLIQ